MTRTAAPRDDLASVAGLLKKLDICMLTTHATDGALNSDPVTVTIHVNPNTVPTAVGESYTATEDVARVVTSGGITANDIDPDVGDPKIVVLVPGGGPTKGNLFIDASTGNFTYTASVTSGAQTQAKTFTFSVAAPTLTTNNVLLQLFGSGSPLSADEQRYLDFLGNNNNGFDIGDFLAWVKATGAPLSPAVLQSLPRRKGGSQ